VATHDRAQLACTVLAHFQCPCAALFKILLRNMGHMLLDCHARAFAQFFVGRTSLQSLCFCYRAYRFLGLRLMPHGTAFWQYCGIDYNRLHRAFQRQVVLSYCGGAIQATASRFHEVHAAPSQVPHAWVAIQCPRIKALGPRVLLEAKRTTAG